ncbi:MAG TPA: pilin [bacterium]|nr:pilin [bacterium]
MKFNKIIISAFLSLILFFPTLSMAQTNDTEVPTPAPASQMDLFQQNAGFSSAPAENIVANIISMVLGLLGILFVVLMIFSGYQWMMAGGNEETVKTAQKRIKNAVIGLVIVVMAYAVTAFVFKSLPGGSSDPCPGGGTGENCVQ